MMKQIFLALLLFASMAFAASENITVNAASLQGTFKVGGIFYCNVNVTSTLDTTLHINWSIVKNGATTINSGTNLTYVNSTYVTVGEGVLGTVAKGDKVSCKIIASSPRDDDTADAYYSANQTIVNSVPSIVTPIAKVNMVPHTLNITATFRDVDDSADFATFTANSTGGQPCIYDSNTTTAFDVTISYICGPATSAGPFIFDINATDVSGDSVVSSDTWSFPNSLPVVAAEITFADEVLYHKFNYTLNISDADGEPDLISGVPTLVNATCTFVSASTTATSYAPKYNCTGTQDRTSISAQYTMTDLFGATAVSATADHVVSDSAPTVGVFTFTNEPAQGIGHIFNATATFTDLDGFADFNMPTRTPTGDCAFPSYGTGTDTISPLLVCTRTTSNTITVCLNETNTYGNSAGVCTAHLYPNVAPTMVTQPVFVANGAGHKFNVSAKATDADAVADIVTVSVAAAGASCTYSSNATDPLTGLTVIYNCTGIANTTAYARFTFTDVFGLYVYSNNSSYMPPNLVPTAPTVLSPLNSTFSSVFVNCSATDLDGDTLTYRAWYSNDSGGNWTILYTGLPACNYTWNAVNQSNLNTYKIKINVSDSGGATNQTTSAVFTVIPGSATDFPYAVAGTIVIIVAAVYTLTRSGKKT